MSGRVLGRSSSSAVTVHSDPVRDALRARVTATAESVTAAEKLISKKVKIVLVGEQQLFTAGTVARQYWDDLDEVVLNYLELAHPTTRVSDPHVKQLIKKYRVMFTTHIDKMQEDKTSGMTAQCAESIIRKKLPQLSVRVHKLIAKHDAFLFEKKHLSAKLIRFKTAADAKQYRVHNKKIFSERDLDFHLERLNERAPASRRKEQTFINDGDDDDGDDGDDGGGDGDFVVEEEEEEEEEDRGVEGAPEPDYDEEEVSKPFKSRLTKSVAAPAVTKSVAAPAVTKSVAAPAPPVTKSVAAPAPGTKSVSEARAPPVTKSEAVDLLSSDEEVASPVEEVVKSKSRQELKKEIKDLSGAIEVLETEIEQRDETIAVWSGKVDRRNELIKKLKSKVEEVEKEKEELESLNTTFKDLVDKYEPLVSKYEDKIAELREELRLAKLAAARAPSPKSVDVVVSKPPVIAARAPSASPKSVVSEDGAESEVYDTTALVEFLDGPELATYLQKKRHTGKENSEICRILFEECGYPDLGDFQLGDSNVRTLCTILAADPKKMPLIAARMKGIKETKHTQQSQVQGFSSMIKNYQDALEMGEIVGDKRKRVDSGDTSASKEPRLSPPVSEAREPEEIDGSQVTASRGLGKSKEWLLEVQKKAEEQVAARAAARAAAIERGEAVSSAEEDEDEEEAATKEGGEEETATKEGGEEETATKEGGEEETATKEGGEASETAASADVTMEMAEEEEEAEE